jgi:anaerobic selenocysteine-containing dehydrogenase
MGPVDAMPTLPDQWDSIEPADAARPFRLATSPARNFLNSTFTETPGSLVREGAPAVMIHSEDAAALGVAEGQTLELGNARGSVLLAARLFDGVRRGVLIAEGVWPNAAHLGGRGINTLVGADPVAPFGGAAFHDVAVWARPA